ncbi:MAG: DUF6216 family protein [Pseudomonas sp.]
MTTPTPATIPLTWNAESIASLGGIATVLLFAWLLWFIYSRAGSLFFLRDLIWRSFGGKTEFENNPQLNTMRREMREVELFRYEFNIPASTLSDAELAQRWIIANRLAPADVGRSRNYIDWSDFNAPAFKVKRFSPLKFKLWGLLFTLLLLLLAPLPTLTEAKYLAVSLKNAPDAPGFYLSENDIKFDWFADDFLTVEKCRSSATLQPFIREGLPETQLDLICSFFIDPSYVEHVRKGLREQRSLLLGLALFCMAGTLLIVLKIARMERASKLHRLSQNAVSASGHPVHGGQAAT